MKKTINVISSGGSFEVTREVFDQVCTEKEIKIIRPTIRPVYYEQEKAVEDAGLSRFLKLSAIESRLLGIIRSLRQPLTNSTIYIYGSRLHRTDEFFLSLLQRTLPVSVQIEQSSDNAAKTLGESGIYSASLNDDHWTVLDYRLIVSAAELQDLQFGLMFAKACVGLNDPFGALWHLSAIDPKARALNVAKIAYEEALIIARHLPPNLRNPAASLGKIESALRELAEEEENERAILLNARAFLKSSTEPRSAYQDAVAALDILTRNAEQTHPLDDTKSFTSFQAIITNNLGHLADRGGETSQALTHFTEAYMLDPSNIPFLCDLVESRISNGIPKLLPDEELTLTHAAEFDFQASFMLGVFFSEVSNSEQALRYLRHAVNLAPDFHNIRLHLVQELCESEIIAEAAEHVRKIDITLLPPDLKVRLSLLKLEIASYSVPELERREFILMELFELSERYPKNDLISENIDFIKNSGS